MNFDPFRTNLLKISPKSVLIVENNQIYALSVTAGKKFDCIRIRVLFFAEISLISVWIPLPRTNCGEKNRKVLHANIGWDTRWTPKQGPLLPNLILHLICLLICCAMYDIQSCTFRALFSERESQWKKFDWCSSETQYVRSSTPISSYSNQHGFTLKLCHQSVLVAYTSPLLSSPTKKYQKQSNQENEVATLLALTFQSNFRAFYCPSMFSHEMNNVQTHHPDERM